MIGVINAIIYGRLRARGGRGFERLRAAARRSDPLIDQPGSLSHGLCSSFKLIICSPLLAKSSGRGCCFADEECSTLNVPTLINTKLVV